VLDNLPVGTMASTGEGPVIAVDVTGRMGEFRKPSRPGLARLGRPIRRYLTGTDAEVPRLGETIVRTVTVGSSDTAEAARRHADLVIQPQVEGVGILDWRQLDRVVE
jgi:predicted acylesterase/phospholipase RssA